MLNVHLHLVFNISGIILINFLMFSRSQRSLYKTGKPGDALLSANNLSPIPLNYNVQFRLFLAIWDIVSSQNHKVNVFRI